MVIHNIQMIKNLSYLKSSFQKKLKLKKIKGTKSDTQKFQEYIFYKNLKVKN